MMYSDLQYPEKCNECVFVTVCTNPNQCPIGEIVYCKDCKYHECTDVCEMHGSNTEEHEFCSRGERGDNEEKAVKWE